MEQLQTQSAAAQSSSQQMAAGHRHGYATSHTGGHHRSHGSSGGGVHHTKNQHSYSSSSQANKQRTTNSNSAADKHSRLTRGTQESNEKDQSKRSNYQGGNSAAPSAQSRRQQEQTSSSKKQSQRHQSRVSSLSKGGFSVNIPPLSLENSFKSKRPITECQTMEKSLQSAQQLNQYYEDSGAANAGQQRLISDIIGGNDLSPIGGDAKPTGQERSETGVIDSEEAKRQQLRQMKNLQKLQKSGQSRKKSNQFGKSNKILLMSGTKSKLMEMSVASATVDKSLLKASGAISKGTATLIELGRVTQGVPDQLKGDGPEGASQTYNNASKLLVSANEIELDGCDYGAHNHTNGHLRTTGKNMPTVSREGSQGQLMMTMGNFDSEDGEIQAPDGLPMTSVFDQLEEMQFMSYELGTKLRSLVDIIIQNSAIDQQYMAPDGQGLIVQPDTWDSIGNVAKEATTDFEMIQESLRSFFDRMQEEVAKWKRRCSKLQTKLQTVVVSRATEHKTGVPPKPMGVSKSLGRHATNGRQEKSGRITVSGNGGRKGQFKQSNSLNHSGVQSKKERLMLQKSLIEIVNVYDKNRTQIYSNLEEMESRVNEFKNTREKLNVQHLGTMTTVEQEMEQLCLRSARSQKSTGQALKSHRSHSASKRPMTSLEASRRSSRPDHPSEYHQSQQNKNSERKEAVMNTPKIMSASKQKPKAQSSGIRSPVNRPQSLVPPLPIHMINGGGNSKEPQRHQKKSQLNLPQNSARSAHSKPPPPESYRSQRSQNRGGAGAGGQGNQSHRSAGGNNGGISRRSGLRSGHDSLAGSSAQNITGAIVNGALVNNVMLQANKIGTSKFDKALEADYEGDEATLMFDTERLKQFPEDYARYEALESTDQKILVKQMLFMKYEPMLKKQAKIEKEQKEQKRRERRAQEKQNFKNRRQNSQGSGFNASNPSNRSNVNRNSAKDVELGQILDISAIQLESSLSEIGTIEGFKARQEEKNLLQEAQMSEMMAISQNISGLKTVTQKDLVLLAEKQWQQYEQLKKEDRKVLPWVAGDDESNHEARSEKLLADLSVDDYHNLGPNSNKGGHQQLGSVPISPSHVQMQLLQGKPSGSLHGGQNDNAQKSFNNSSRLPSNEDQEPSPIKRIDSSQPPGESFYNDSSLVEDFENLTPQQVRAIGGSYPVGAGVGGNNLQGRQPMKSMLTLDQAQVVNYNGGNVLMVGAEGHLMAHGGVHQSNVDDAYDHHGQGSSLINQVANATSNSEESSLLIANQKKSLEMITERESEFSNTMGTFARPSQRSKQSKAPSSGAKYNGTRGQNSSAALVNGSNASLNNSSAQINSSRQKRQVLVGSFADISGENCLGEPQMLTAHEESKLSVGRQQSAHKSNVPNQQQYRGGQPQGALAANSVSQVGYRNQPGDNQTADAKSTSKQRAIDSSVQFTDLATQTPIRQIGAVNASAGRKQILNDSNSNVTKSQIAYQHLMHELKSNQGNDVEDGQPIMPQQLRQRQQNVVDLAGSEIQMSYGADTSYIDESLQSSSVDHHGLSSVKKQRKQRQIGGGGGQHHVAPDGTQSTPIAQQTTQLKRSNSEVYIKDTSMQNNDDALFVPIMYAMDASCSLQQSVENAKVRIDQSQLNNLTRYLEANNSARKFGNGPDSNGTFQINNTLYNQLQRLFMQHQTMRSALQDSTVANNISLSKSAGKVNAGSQKITGIVEPPGIIKSAGGFGITSHLNESLQQPQLQKRTLEMLQHLQGYQMHNLNSVVGIIFSNSSQTKGLFPQTGRQNFANSLLKKTTSPIVDHFSNAPLNKSDLKKSLMEGLQLIKANELGSHSQLEVQSLLGQHHHQHQNANNPIYENYSASQNDEALKFKSEIAPAKNKLNVSSAATAANNSHSRGLSKETVSSYAHQIKRPVTNMSYHQSNLSSGNDPKSSLSSHHIITNPAGAIHSANVKTGAKQVNHQLLQKSLMAYQSTEFNPRDQRSSSDYVDHSMISASLPNNSSHSHHSMVSKSVERVSGSGGDSTSQVSAQSNLQRKLRLKTNKQLKIITERNGSNKPRPASSMAVNNTSAVITNSTVTNNGGSSEGRQTVHGKMNVSTISAKPQGQFKILQFSSSVRKKSGSSTRDQSSGSANTRHLQLQSQPQFTKQQQLQIQLQQKTLASQLASSSTDNYGNTNSAGSANLDSHHQKGPVLKRINIKKNPSIRRQVDQAKQQIANQKLLGGGQAAGTNVRNVRNQVIQNQD